MKTEDWELQAYDYDLPTELIAQHPTNKRDDSRLLQVDRERSEISHHRFPEIQDLLPESCCLVLNNTRVLPLRLLGRRSNGGEIETLLIKEQRPGIWSALVKKAKRVRSNETLEFSDGKICARALERTSEGYWLLEFAEPETLMKRLERFGLTPLPPYVQRRISGLGDIKKDRERYQTYFASIPGAIAAPTAGLHFTQAILDELKVRDTLILELTLHVGLGTFSGVETPDVREHRMHREFFSINRYELDRLQESRISGRKIIAVGTTVVRVLETLARENFRRNSGWTDIFIYPPYEFQMIDGLLTNFHMPRSTLIMLVSAFCGRKTLLKAYSSAIQKAYRFFSYGDCMFIQ